VYFITNTNLYKYWSENLKETDNSEDKGVDWIIFKMDLQETRRGSVHGSINRLMELPVP
jgi:hypothetical protein